jgi:hypothetical protein
LVIARGGVFPRSAMAYIRCGIAPSCQNRLDGAKGSNPLAARVVEEARSS